MRKTFLGLSAAAALAVSASAAHATTFSWSFTDGGSNTGSGTFDATQDLIADPTGTTFQINSVSGTVLGENIIGLTNYGTADNVIYWSPTSPTHFDSGNPYYHTGYYGVGFALANGNYYDLYEEAGIQPAGWSCGGASVPYCLLGPNTDPTYDGAGDPVVALTDFAVARTPLPAALPLFASGLSALGFIGYRRRRQRA